MTPARKPPRFWLVYAAAWLPFAIVHFAIVVALGARPLGAAVLYALLTVGVAGLLGVGVVWACERLPWSPNRRMPFALGHALLAQVYALLWAAGVVLAFSVEESVVAGRWTPLVPPGAVLYWQFLFGMLVYGTVASIAYVVQTTTSLREARWRAERAEALQMKAELAALRSSLNPHFLFNTLHSVMALVRHNPQAAEDALERFADMLRYVLKEGGERHAEVDDVSLKSEWKFVQDYLELESLRLGDRLRVETKIAPESLDCPVPAFTLQPLVENAIRHAIAPFARAGTVGIATQVGESGLVIEVRDDGPGADREQVAASPGIGLRVVRQRLEIRYAMRARLDVGTSPDGGFVSTIRIPLDEAEAV